MSNLSIRELHSKIGFQLTRNILLFVLSFLAYILILLGTVLSDLHQTSEEGQRMFLKRLTTLKESAKTYDSPLDVHVVHRMMIGRDGKVIQSSQPLLVGVKLNPTGFFGTVRNLDVGDFSLIYQTDLVDGLLRVHFIQGTEQGFLVFSMNADFFFPSQLSQHLAVSVVHNGVLRFSTRSSWVGNLHQSSLFSWDRNLFYMNLESELPSLSHSRIVVSQSLNDKFMPLGVASLIALVLFLLINRPAFKTRQLFLDLRREHQDLVSMMEELNRIMVTDRSKLTLDPIKFSVIFESVYQKWGLERFQLDENRLIYGLIRIITREFIETLNQVYQGEARFHSLVATANEGIIITDLDGRILFANQAAGFLFHLKSSMLEGRDVGSLLTPESRTILKCLQTGTCDEDPDYQNSGLASEVLGLRGEATFSLEISFALWKTGEARFATIFMRDISDRKQAESRLLATLKEKNVLIKELFHRTRNNMGSIMALIRLQIDYLTEGESKRMLNETLQRIQSMALAQQKLYDGHDLSHINLGQYLRELAFLIAKEHPQSGADVKLDLVLEDVQVLIDTAVPCGLILNELLTNSLKYAFPQGRVGKVTLELRQDSEGVILFRVQDNGVGLPTGFNLEKDGRIGLKEILLMAESQLNAQVAFTGTEGVECILRFRDNLYSPRV